MYGEKYTTLRIKPDSNGMTTTGMQYKNKTRIKKENTRQKNSYIIFVKKLIMHRHFLMRRHCSPLRI